MKIGLLQFAPELGGFEHNLQRIEALLANAGSADLVVLPELASSGYDFGSRLAAEAAAESVSGGRYVAFLREQSRRLDCAIVSGLAERDGDKIYNSAVLVDGDAPVHCYRKLHLFKDEKQIFDPGDRAPEVVDCRGLKVGLLVCFDWAFPELWRKLALDGAELVAMTANLVLPGFAQRAVAVHAQCNGYYVACANRVGTEGPLTFTGCSLLADPRGEPLLHGSSDGEELRIAEIDPARARDKWITPANHLLEDRRPEFYGGLGQA